MQQETAAPAARMAERPSLRQLASINFVQSRMRRTKAPASGLARQPDILKQTSLPPQLLGKLPIPTTMHKLPGSFSGLLNQGNAVSFAWQQNFMLQVATNSFESRTRPSRPCRGVCRRPGFVLFAGPPMSVSAAMNPAASVHGRRSEGATPASRGNSPFNQSCSVRGSPCRVQKFD